MPSAAHCISVPLFMLLLVVGCASDASIRRHDNSFTLCTASVERTIAFRDGRLLLTSLKDRSTTRQLLPAKTAIPDFSLLVGPNRTLITSATPGWKLVDANEFRLSQNERRLDLTLEREQLRITRSYILYPRSSIIREATTITNLSDSPLIVAEPTFHCLASVVGALDSTDFFWITGAHNVPGLWDLKTEKLAPNIPRTFDSYDPPPHEQTPPRGDGINARIELNQKQIWPQSGWAYSANAGATVPFDIKTHVQAGDHIAFRVNMNKNIGWDTTTFDPTITYADGESHTASREFSSEQGKNNWRYAYIENGNYVHMTWYPGESHNWRKKPDNATQTPFVDAARQHPDVNQDAVRVWTAPRTGDVRITGSICNSGNSSLTGKPGFRPGTTSYAPWYALYNRQTKQGLFIGFDYFGHWSSRFEAQPDNVVRSELKMAGFSRDLRPGQSITTPWSFTGLFHDDLDNAGNEVLDWQYVYLWDYTRDGSNGAYPWFPALRTLGYWMKGTGWGQPGVPWTGGNPDLPSTFRKVFRIADYMRCTGTDVYHRDWGWWDVAGDWNGPDFRATGDYLRKHSMGQLIYAFLYTVAPNSKVAREHPDWLLGADISSQTLDMSRPEVVQFMQSQLDDFVKRFGDFEWRNDSFFTYERKNDPSVLLEQDMAFRKILKDFLDKYPNCGFQAVNGGGNYAGYEYLRFASNVQYSDGAVGLLRNQWSALLFPPDKNCDNPDQWDPDHYDKSIWRGLLTFNYDTTGDTIDPAKLEGIRELNDIYHYLLAKGVVGRYVRVYRPTITGDDPVMYFQRLSGDRKRGIIIPKRPAPAAVTIVPKGLVADHVYTVSFHESDASHVRLGGDLMKRGITLKKMPPGELIYLNLPLHPGSKLDKNPPTPPKPLAVKPAANMGYPGVELTWKPGSDDNWVSYYQIYRNGEPIDKVAKGLYCFDHSAGADIRAKYEIRTVDGAGNMSEKTAFPVAAGKPAIIIDDAAITFTGPWKNLANPASHANTLSMTGQKDASAELSVQGTRVLVFVRLAADAGKFSATIDDQAPQVVDTFSADDIYGVAVFQRDLAPGQHTLRLTVLPDRNPLSKGNSIYLDAVRVEQE